MMDENGNLTESGGKKNKQVMVRIPRTTMDRIDDFASDTHSSRPDLITDSVRQYITHVMNETSSVIVQIEDLDVSKQAKEVYFTQQMGERLFTEFEAYRKSKAGNQKTQDVSVLISMPLGLQKMISDVVKSTGLFSSNQEFIKVSVYYMFYQMSEIRNRMEIVERFQAMPDGKKALEEELEQIKKELQGE